MLGFAFLFIFFLLLNADEDLKESLKTALRSTKLNKLASIYKNDPFSYDNEGFLTLHGKWQSNTPRKVNLFFKESAAKCARESKMSGVNFDISVCIPHRSSCKKGMKICYASVLTADNVKDPRKYEMRKVRNDIDCPDKSLHALQILTEYNVTSKTNEVIISASIDKNDYKFSQKKQPNTRNDCFKIRIGESTTVATSITDLDDNLIKTIPEIESIKGREWLEDGWSRSSENLHLLALDFIPQRDEQLLGFGDYYMNFSYFGGGEDCKMFMKLASENVLQCTPFWEMRADICNFSPKRKKKEMNSSLNGTNFEFKRVTNQVICKVEHTEEKTTSMKTLKRDVFSTGTWNSNEMFKKGLSISIGAASLAFATGAKPLSGVSIPMELLNIQEYVKLTDQSRTNKAVDRAIESSILQTTSISHSREYSVYPGEKIIEEELVIKCNGWIYNTDYIRVRVIRDKP